ncbi:hypothetical protein JAO76_17830 [Pontibacter sp. BT310]|uniref:Restriction endonuclease n=1 Tax=Pontibacter populi TaxID=890055 RepID=A0ABS6XGY1_9BACT|nr:MULTISPECIES: hypothetical protein [Pontibacter]MBJ6120071.1 hypothetical protein [Pontibacter sp. BT310]MBR0572500.1 hypothetical protein [Microvirga sp. STS03]MBW3366924.1 hypothetical protein [Pontibacter populi]
MRKISIKNLVEFRQRSERSKLTFLNNIRKDKKANPDESGGDYWVSCLSAISNVFGTEDTSLINQKIDVLRNKIKETEHTNNKNRWQKNIDILQNFEDFDFKSIKPDSNLIFHKKSDLNSIINLDGIPIESKPHHVFSYTNKDQKEVGAVWFIAKKNGYKKNELGMFCDIMHRSLTMHYSDKYKINPAYCIAVDVFNCQDVNFSQLLSGEVSILLGTTVDEIKKLLTK